MIFILVAWSLVLLTFTIWMRALHSIPIYTSTASQLQDQTLQIKTVTTITQMLLALAIACFGLHFAVENDGSHKQTQHVHNTSAHAFDMQSLQLLLADNKTQSST
jgi:hypothetical protein